MKVCAYRGHSSCATGQWWSECKLTGEDKLSDEMDCEHCKDCVWDIDKMCDAELLEELADRLLEWERCLESIDAWHIVCDNDLPKGAQGDIIAEDEAFCRVREIVRKVKGDDRIWEC